MLPLHTSLSKLLPHAVDSVGEIAVQRNVHASIDHVYIVICAVSAVWWSGITVGV